MVPLDLAVAAVIAADFAARLWIEPDRRRHLMSLAHLADIAVMVSLLLPAFVDNLGFLRIAQGAQAAALLPSPARPQIRNPLGSAATRKWSAERSTSWSSSSS